MRVILLILTVITVVFSARSTHIVGGSFTYEHLGGSSYNVKLKLYRDCAPGTFGYPNDVTVQVRDGNGGTTGLNFTMPRLGIVELDPPIDTCAVDPGICVEEAVFSSIVSLPPSNNGYHLYWGVCCRNGSIINIDDPLGTTELFHTYIPNNAQWLTNSSPDWVNFPPVFVCQGEDVDFDHSATDADGDSLVYSLYTPYQNNVLGYTGGVNPPDNINFLPVVWETGFGVNSMLNPGGANPLTIDPQTGLLSGIPNNLGQYVVGVKCEEWRDGEKIGVIVRDFQFNVVDCPPPQNAGIGPVTACEGGVAEMINASGAGAEDFLWDFGDGSPTSTDFEPTHTYAAEGDYLITLVAQEGTLCADTATYTIKVGGVEAGLPEPDPTCISSSVNFEDTSVTTSNQTVNSWQWDFGDGSAGSTVPNPSHTFNSSGNLEVTLIVGTDGGCFDTIVRPISIQGLPNADVGPDTTACFNNPNISLNGVVTNAGGGVWVGNGGTFNPNTTDLNANYDPSQAEINDGSTQLILSTTDNGLCPSNQDTLIIDFIDGPTVDAGDDIEVCRDTSSVPLSASFQFSGGIEWFTNEGTGTFDNALNSNTQYFPSAADAQEDSIKIYIQTIINGNCFGDLDSLYITFFDPPTIDLNYEDTICEGNPVFLDANSTTGNGLWTTTGDGNFENDTANVTSYFHGNNDLISGNVTIFFRSLDNGGCQVQRDTIDIAVIPSPSIDFNFTDECFGTPTEFTSDVTSVVAISEYEWTFNDSILFSDEENPDYIIPQTGDNEVTLIVYAENGCSDTITKDVFTYYLPDVDFSTPAPCLNGGTQYFDDTEVPGGESVEWEWSFGDGENSDEQDPMHQYPDADEYNVTLIVTTDQGCVDSLTQLVDIYPGPNAQFTPNPSSAYVEEDISFDDETESDFPISNWDWDFEDGNFSEEQSPSHDYAEGGDYEVVLIVEDENGCIDTTSQTVNIYLPPLVPAAFSPNGDNNNDVLFVYGGPFETLEFKVYNNWGEVIFESNQQSDGWDGTFKGEEQPVGVYVWTVRATSNDGVEHEIAGDSSLIR